MWPFGNRFSVHYFACFRYDMTVSVWLWLHWILFCLYWVRFCLHQVWFCPHQISFACIGCDFDHIGYYLLALRMISLPLEMEYQALDRFCLHRKWLFWHQGWIFYHWAGFAYKEMILLAPVICLYTWGLSLLALVLHQNHFNCTMVIILSPPLKIAFNELRWFFL